MDTLDDIDAMKKLDLQDMITSLGMLPDQMEHAWEDTKNIDLPEDYKDVDNLVVFGMGGSALGSHVLQHLYATQLKVPVTIVSDYHVPGFVNERSLVLLSSYSGSTEEVVQAGQSALKTGAKVLAIAAGKDIVDMAESEKLPIYKVDPKFNLCDQPRVAVGYAIAGQLALFSRLGLFPLEESEITASAAFLRTLAPSYAADTPASENLAKQLALKLVDMIPVLSPAEHLQGAARVFRNQCNENGKHMGIILEIPEMNHWAMEGLGNPDSVKHLLFLLFRSKLYHERNQKRFEVLRTILKKYGIADEVIDVPGETKLQQALALIMLGGHISFYIGMLHDLDPSPIPYVDLFKAELGK